MSRSSLWEVTSRVDRLRRRSARRCTASSASSASCCPGTTNVSVRPAFALVPFFGYAFGPIVGLFVGFVGNAIGDQLLGYGFLTYWNWSLANGLVGFVAGLAPLYLGRMMDGPISRRAIGGAIAGVVGSVIGFLFVFSDIWRRWRVVRLAADDGLHPDRRIADIIVSVILIPILVYAWEPVKDQLGR